MSGADWLEAIALALAGINLIFLVALWLATNGEP